MKGFADRAGEVAETKAKFKKFHEEAMAVKARYDKAMKPVMILCFKRGSIYYRRRYAGPPHPL